MHILEHTSSLTSTYVNLSIHFKTSLQLFFTLNRHYSPPYIILFVSFSQHDDGGQQVQSNDWVWGSDTSHDAPKEFKSMHELSYGHEQYYTEDKPCTQRPKTPMNSNVQCTLKSNSCKATCLRDYQFPNGDTSMPIICEDGVWSEIPSCERMFDI